MVQVQRSTTWKWPTVVAKGEGQGALVRVELRPSEACWSQTPGGVLVAGTASVRVRLGEPEQRSRRTGSPERSAPTSRDQNLPVGRSLPSEEDSLAPPAGLSSLEVGAYALMGALCSALLGFLLSCASAAYKNHSEQEPSENPGMVSHDWVWLGQEEGLHLPGFLEEGGLPTGPGTRARNGSTGRSEVLNSPTSKRKRVKFTTFSSTRSGSACPRLGPLAPVQDLGEPKDPRRDPEKLHKELN